MVLPKHHPGEVARDAPWKRCLVRSRGLLLDALEALAPLSPHVVVGGGQAIDVRLSGAGFPPPPWTRDGDLTLDPAGLPGTPVVASLLRGAGLVPADGHGTWGPRTSRLRRLLGPGAGERVDVVVPAEGEVPDLRDGAVAVVRPMVLTLLDDEWMEVPALDPEDGRRARARVAGLGSLLLTKAHRFRMGCLHAAACGRPEATIGRKDALDAVRLLLSPGDDLERDVARIRAHPRGASTAEESIGVLSLHFATRDGLGSRLAACGDGTRLRDDEAARARERAAAICAAARGGRPRQAPEAGRNL